MSLKARMNKTAAIYRPSASRSATGTVTRPVPGAPVATTRCALFPKRGETRTTEGGLLLEADAVAWFPAGTDLRPRLSHSSSTGEGDVVEIESVRYRVLAVRDPVGRGKYLEAALKREA